MSVRVTIRWGIWSFLLVQTAAVGAARPCAPNCECPQDSLQANCSTRRLSTVPEGFGEDTRSLNLSHNRVKALERRQFPRLPLLQELDLSHNLIAVVEVEAFQGLQDLRNLSLRSNRLRIVSPGVFSGLSRLQLLDISENQILVLLDFTFRGLSRLQLLDAGGNELVFVSPRAFDELPELRELRLERCNLSSVPSEALSPLRGLRRLHLRHLTVPLLPARSFVQMQHLRELHISLCPTLDTLDPSSLAGLNLTSLTVSSCNLTAVPYASVQHLAHLTYLDLSHNPITVVHGNLLAGLLRLQEFHLSGGNLLRIDPGAFRGLVHLRLLNVSSNQLSTLEDGVFHSAGSLDTLRADGNPLSCDCRLLWLLRRRLRLSFDGRPPTCSIPGGQRRMLGDFAEDEVTGVFGCTRARIVHRDGDREVEVPEGGTAVLNCQAEGFPSPEISWTLHQQAMSPSNGRFRTLANGTLEIRQAREWDSGTFLCVARNAGGEDSRSVALRVTEAQWTPSPPVTPTNASFPFDAKTLVVAMTMGCLSFLSSVVLCFVFMLFWSQSRGQIKHSATIDFVPRSSLGSGDGGDAGRFTMKLI